MKIIQKSAYLSVIASLALVGTGCQNMNTVERNTAVGAGIGAGAGALIADDSLKGAAIGALAGGAGGWALGKNKQKNRGY